MILQWETNKGESRAAIGVQGDGVDFYLTHYPTCYRRGPWQLMVEVRGGEAHHFWGCFDDADQPMRWFHRRGNAVDEAESIARVLLQDRLKRGPIGGPPTPAGSGA